MLYFTNYANQKFEILNKYKVFITKEEIEELVKKPDTTVKKGKYIFLEKNNIKAIIKKENNLTKLITFYPIN